MREKSKAPCVTDVPGQAAPRGAVDVFPGRIIESRELLAGAREILIHHEGRIYRLRHTRLGKLILTA